MCVVAARCGLLRGSMCVTARCGLLRLSVGCYGVRCGLLRHGSAVSTGAAADGPGRGHGAPGGGRVVRFLVELDASVAVGVGRAGGAARMGGGGYRRQTGLLLLVVVALSGLHHSQVSALPKRTGEVRLPYMLLADVFQTISAT